MFNEDRSDEFNNFNPRETAEMILGSPVFGNLQAYKVEDKKIKDKMFQLRNIIWVRSMIFLLSVSGGGLVCFACYIRTGFQKYC